MWWGPQCEVRFRIWPSTYFEFDSPVLDGQQLSVDNDRSSLKIIRSFKVAARSKLWVCGRSLPGIVGSNLAGDMDVYLLSVLCFVR